MRVENRSRLCSSCSTETLASEGLMTENRELRRAA